MIPSRPASRSGIRNCLSAVPAALLLATVGFPRAGVAETPKPGAGILQCWSPAALTVKPGEPLIRHRARGSRVDIPVLASTLPPVLEPLRGSIRRVDLPPGRKLVALTFDLCETANEIAGYDGRVVDILRRQGVKATFFAGGHWMLTHGSRAAQLVADPRFELGNHSWTHAKLRLLSGKPLAEQILKPQAAYARVRASLAENRCVVARSAGLKAVPAQMKLFRFPFGSCSPRALDAVADAGLLSIQWDVATGDPARGQSAKRIVATVLRQVRPGSIVLAHANGRGWHTARALPAIIDKLKARGYEFVTVSELLAAGTPVIAKTCYDHKPGDTLAYEGSRRKSAAPKKIASRKPHARPFHR